MNIHLGFIEKCIDNFLTKFCSLDSLGSKKSIQIFLIKLPHLGNISHHVEKKLKEFIRKHLPATMFRFIHVNKNLKQQLHFKDP